MQKHSTVMIDGPIGQLETVVTLPTGEARGIALVDSPHCGAMHWRSTQPDALACERQLHARYWQHRPP